MTEQAVAFEEHRGFPGVVGAFDGWHSVNLQAVCGHDLEFIQCYARWSGSVHDARVLRNSPLFMDATADPNLLFAGDRHILVL